MAVLEQPCCTQLHTLGQTTVFFDDRVSYLCAGSDVRSWQHNSSLELVIRIDEHFSVCVQFCTDFNLRIGDSPVWNPLGHPSGGTAGAPDSYLFFKGGTAYNPRPTKRLCAVR